MRKCLSVIFSLVLFLTSTVVTTIAGPRYHSSAYHNDHYSSPYVHHRPYYRGHPYQSDHVWTHLGISLLSGALIGSILYLSPREHSIIYSTPPPVIVYTDPVVFSQRYAPTSPQRHVVLRRVRTTPGVLNVRSAPDLQANISGQVKQNAILDVLGAAPEWLYIRTETGLYGWVMTQFTREDEDPVG